MRDERVCILCGKAAVGFVYLQADVGALPLGRGLVGNDTSTHYKGRVYPVRTRA